MKYITYNEYLKYSSILQIAEQETEYGISEPQENRRYNQEELITQTNKIIEMIKETKDKEILAEIITNIIAPRVGKEQASKMLGKIKDKEKVKIMSPLTKMLLDLKLEGKEEGILSTAKKCCKEIWK